MKEELFKGIEGIIDEVKDSSKPVVFHNVKNVFKALEDHRVPYILVSNTIRNKDFEDTSGAIWEVYIMRQDYPKIKKTELDKFFPDDEYTDLVVKELGVNEMRVLPKHLKTLRKVFDNTKGRGYEPHWCDFRAYFETNKTNKTNEKNNNN